MNGEPPRYRRLADELAQLIQGGTLRPGDRLPSVRQTQASRGCSAATVFQAYHLLEARGLIHAAQRSGYFVSPAAAPPPARTTEAQPVAVSELVFQLLGTGGHEGRRRQIALRYLRLGLSVAPDEIVLTDGALEGLNLSLQLLTRPGDAVLVESPCFYAAVLSQFPPGTRVTQPQGGYFMWVELPPGHDSLALQHAARQEGISPAPGPLFSASGAFRHCLRLNGGQPWTPALAGAVTRQGQLIRSQTP